MRLWIDDVRPAPEGYVWCKSVNETIDKIKTFESYKFFDPIKGYPNKGRLIIIPIDEINIDHDAGDYVNDGGDYIKLLDWMETVGYTPYAIHIHSMNPVGVENMRRIIRKNGWREV